jgi:rhamnulokinase
MDRFFIACALGAGSGRVSLGHLNRDTLVVSEIRHFQNTPIEDDDSPHWNVSKLYEEVMEGLRSVATYEEPVEGVSFSSWGSDYLLIDSDGAVISPSYHRADARAEEGMKKVLSKVSLDQIYQETGVQPAPGDTIFQLASEKPKRLSKAHHLMPMADGFNYLLSGVARVEFSSASRTQLFNPMTREWSQQLLEALSLPKSIFPEVVEAGTVLGPMHPTLAKKTGLLDTQVVTSCSHDIAAALTGLPVNEYESWAYLRSGTWSVMGTETEQPIIDSASRDGRFTNELGFMGRNNFYRHAAGLNLLRECQRTWENEGRGMDEEMLIHLAGATPPFESLIDPGDPAFLTPGDTAAKIQAFCRDTHQPPPRKPGPIARCILESLALSFRRTLLELEAAAGKKINRLYVLDGSPAALLYHFTANALNLPVVVLQGDPTAVGNIIVQALALGHIKSPHQARELIRRSLKTQTILPHGNWQEPYERFIALRSE